MSSIYILVHELERVAKIGKADNVKSRVKQIMSPTGARSEPWRFLCSVSGGRSEESLLHTFFAPPAKGWGTNNEVFGVDEEHLLYLRWLMHSGFVSWEVEKQPPAVGSNLWTPNDPLHRLKLPELVAYEEGQASIDYSVLDIPEQWYGRVLHLPELTGDDWYTPEEVLDRCRLVSGDFDLDPATHPYAQMCVRAKRYFTKEDNGLLQDWAGIVWCNPPFSRWKDFAPKVVSEWKSGRVTEMFVLAPTRSLGNQQVFVMVDACDALFTSYGRMPFWGPLGASSSTDGQIIFYFGCNPDKFAAAMSDLGITWVHSAGYTKPPTPAKVKKRPQLPTSLQLPDADNKSWATDVTRVTEND